MVGNDLGNNSFLDFFIQGLDVGLFFRDRCRLGNIGEVYTRIFGREDVINGFFLLGTRLFTSGFLGTFFSDTRALGFPVGAHFHSNFHDMWGIRGFTAGSQRILPQFYTVLQLFARVARVFFCALSVKPPK